MGLLAKLFNTIFMIIKQVFAYLEENLLPEKGGRIQIIEEPEIKRETMRIYIFDQRFYNYKYIFSFIREEKEVESGPTINFITLVKSGFSGIDHKLEIPFTDEMFYSIKEGLKGIDARFMTELETEVNSYVVPEEEVTEKPTQPAGDVQE